MNIPQTGLPWTTSIEGKEFCSILSNVLRRPIIAWFSNNKHCVLQLYKTSASLSYDEWMVLGHDYDEEKELNPMSEARRLHRIFSDLTQKNGWTMCEFTNGLAFHQAVIEYLKT